MEHIIIVLVEDNPSDIRLFKEAIRTWRNPVSLAIAREGQEAIELLKTWQGELPDLILINVNLPKMSGFEVVQWIRSQAQFESVPAVMLSSSALESDMNIATQVGANSYVHKPTDFHEYCEKIGEIERCYFVRSRRF